jgi:hypothetical protein
MHWLWTILSCLFPRDPVRQCTEALREQVRQTAREAFELGLHALECDAALRCTLEAIIIEYETTLHLVIGARACQIAGLRFDPGERFFPDPTHPKSALELLARLNDLIKELDRLEHLAQLRAIKLTREREADPLGLKKHHPASASIHLSSLAEGGGGGARALARVTEGAARKAGGLKRAPPVFDAELNPKPASQASPARTRTCAFTPGCWRGRDNVPLRPVRPRCAAAGCTSPAGPNAQASPS